MKVRIPYAIGLFPPLLATFTAAGDKIIFMPCDDLGADVLALLWHNGRKGK